MSTLRVDNIRSRTGTAVSITESNSLTVGGGLDVTGNLSVTGSANLNAPTGVATFAQLYGGGANITGVTATGLSGTPDITVGKLTVNSDSTVGGALTITGNLKVDGTQTIVNTETLDVADKTVGVGSTSNATDTTASGAGLEIYASSSTLNNNKTLLWQSASKSFTFNTGLDVKGVVETVSIGSTTEQTPRIADRVCVQFDASSGTVFSHDLANGDVGIVSLTNFPSTKNSLTTFSILFKQKSTIGGNGTTAGIGNTTGQTGIGTNLTIVPLGAAGIVTSAMVSAGSSVTLGATASTTDIVTLAVHYNGSGTGSHANFTTFATGNSNYKIGGVHPGSA